MWPSHGQISGVRLTQAMILGDLDMSDVRSLAWYNSQLANQSTILNSPYHPLQPTVGIGVVFAFYLF